MVSLAETAKKGLVTLLRSLAAIHGITMELTRDSPDVAVQKACKTVSKKAKGDHLSSLVECRSVWEEALQNRRGHGSKRNRGILVDSTTSGMFARRL